MTVVKVAVLASLFVSTATFAQEAAAPAAPAPAKEKKICRNEVPLGSIRTKRTCMTKSQWAGVHAQNGAAADRALDIVRGRSHSSLNGAAPE